MTTHLEIPTNDRVLCIWLPNWPCQRVRASQPLLASQPLVLQVRDPRRGLLVAAHCLAARKLGIRAQMAISEAISLASRSNRTLALQEHDPQEDLDTLCHLAEGAQRFSPMVGIETLGPKLWSGRNLHQPQALFLKISGLSHLFGSEWNLATQILQWLSEQAYWGMIGIADHVGAAWALACFGWHLPQADQSSGNWWERPISQRIFCQQPSDDVAEVLAPLPTAALRIEPSVAHSLQRLGISHVGPLLDLPRQSLASRLGEELPRRIGEALGEIQETLPVLHLPPELCVEFDLEYPTDRRDTLTEIIRRLILQLSERLLRTGHGALRLICRLEAVEKPPLLLQLGLFRPTTDPQHLVPLLATQLEQQWNSPVAIKRLVLQVTLAEPLSWQQPDLFDTDGSMHRQQLARMIDTLSSRLGRKRVLQPVLDGDPQPELAVSFKPLTGRRSSGQKQSTTNKIAQKVAHRKVTHRIERRAAEPLPHDPLRRPTRLFTKPHPIEVTSLKGTEASSQGTPIQIVYRGQRQSIRQHWGPERIESGWWRGPSQRRDYYRIETEQGSWLWIYRQLNNGQWFLHGEFD